MARSRPASPWARPRPIRLLLIDHKVRVDYQKGGGDDSGAFWMSALTIMLPMLFLLGDVLPVHAAAAGGGGKAMSFGKSRRRACSPTRRTRSPSRTSRACDEAKDEVEEIIAFLKDPKKFQRLGGRIPKGVLHDGPAGHR